MKLSEDNQFMAIIATCVTVTILGFATPVVIKDINQVKVEAGTKYFKSEQLVELTDWIFMEGYALGLRHRSLAQDSVYVADKEREAAELLSNIKEILNGK